MTIYLIQDFEADFLWKVSLKILNSGLILKTFQDLMCRLICHFIITICTHHQVVTLHHLNFKLGLKVSYTNFSTKYLVM